MLPADDPAVRQARRRAVAIDRPIDVVLDVLFARPNDLDRAVDFLRDAHGFFDHVRLEAPAEAAADEVVVHDDLVERQAGELSPPPTCTRAHHLRADPDFARVWLHVHGAVHRFHRRVREKRQFVRGIESFALRQSALRSIADGLGDDARLSRWRRGSAPRRSRSKSLAFAPSFQVDVERFEALLGGPHVIADDGDEIVEHDDLAHARHGFRRGVVDVRDLAAEHRAGRQRRELDAGWHRVDAVDRLAVDLVGRIESLQRLADQLEVGYRFERRILRRLRSWLASSISSPYAELAVAAGVGDFAVLGAARGGSTFQRRAAASTSIARALGAGLAQRRPERADRIGVAGHLDPEDRIAVELVVRRRVLDRDLGPVRVELFGEDHRDRGVDALAHLDLRHDQRDLACAGRCG